MMGQIKKGTFNGAYGKGKQKRVLSSANLIKTL